MIETPSTLSLQCIMTPVNHLAKLGTTLAQKNKDCTAKENDTYRHVNISTVYERETSHARWPKYREKLTKCFTLLATIINKRSVPRNAEVQPATSQWQYPWNETFLPFSINENLYISTCSRNTQSVHVRCPYIQHWLGFNSGLIWMIYATKMKGSEHYMEEKEANKLLHDEKYYAVL